MLRKLGEIAKVQFGTHQRPKVNSDVKYLLAKHFDNNGKLQTIEDSFVPFSAKITKALLKEGDILMTGKGFRHFAWTYDKSIGDAVASSLFYIIRPKSNMVLSDYLAIILNTKRVKSQLQNIGRATNIISIPKAELVKLKIVVPPIEQQQQVVKLHQLLQKEIDITTQILHQKEQLFNGFLQQICNQNQ